MDETVGIYAVSTIEQLGLSCSRLFVLASSAAFFVCRLSWIGEAISRNNFVLCSATRPWLRIGVQHAKSGKLLQGLVHPCVLTARVVPDLAPTASRSDFDNVMRKALSGCLLLIKAPPPSAAR